ncbi:sensor histidine kinase [Actinophytocola sp.]|uniref:sensor histidine kinase n=1 Tax=Actinophytocola sp. TaxID=1872138 RepID=UPI003D6B5B9C
MSDLPRSEPSTEPRGLRLPYGSVAPARGAPDPFGRLRTQLVNTAVIAGCVIVLMAGAGVAVIAAGLYPATNVSFGLAAGTVVVGIAAALRVFYLFRALQQLQLPVPAPAPPRETYLVPEPWSPQAVEWRAPLAVPAEVATPMFVPGGVEQWGDVFGKLSRRLQSLVNRLIRSIDKMEHELEDPELLDMLWGIDHLATLVRRQAENIAVLGGETLERRSDNPVDVNAVLRSAVAEIQRYRQVVTIPIRDARIHGHVVAEIIHLLSELLDNATTFSSDDAPKVAFRAQYVTAGLTIQVQDRGIGMNTEDLQRINHLLHRDTHLDVGELFKDGRIGLAVVKELARRHDIGVELQPNIYGGIDASIVVPHKLLDNLSDLPAVRRPAAPGRETTSSRAAGSGRVAVAEKKPVPALAPATSPPPRRAPQPAAQAVRAVQPAAQPAAQPAPKPAAPSAAPPVQPAAQPASQPVASGQGAAARSSFTPKQAEPELPTRERGTALAAMRDAAWAAPQPQAEAQTGAQTAAQTGESGGPDRLPDTSAPAAGDRPALPQRREQRSHLRPELRQNPVVTRPIPGHSPNLLADLQLGRVAGQQEIVHGEASADSAGDQDEQ